MLRPTGCEPGASSAMRAKTRKGGSGCPKSVTLKVSNRPTSVCLLPTSKRTSSHSVQSKSCAIQRWRRRGDERGQATGTETRKVDHQTNSRVERSEIEKYK